MMLLLLLLLNAIAAVAGASRLDATLTQVGRNATVTYSDASRARCGTCLLYNTSRPFTVFSNQGSIRPSSSNCPVFYPGVWSLVFPANNVDADVYLWSCCEEELCPDAGGGLMSWTQIVLCVVCLLFLGGARHLLLALLLFIVINVYEFGMRFVINPVKRCGGACRKWYVKRFCRKCGTIKSCNAVYCDACRPTPEFTKLADFLEYYQARLPSVNASATPMNEKLECTICFEREKEWRLSCGHELCLNCTVRSLLLHQTCPFDRCVIEAVPERIRVVVGGDQSQQQTVAV